MSTEVLPEDCRDFLKKSFVVHNASLSPLLKLAHVYLAQLKQLWHF